MAVYSQGDWYIAFCERFVLSPEARAHTVQLRRCYDAQLECMMDRLAVRRGFWAHEIGQPLAPSSSLRLDR